MSYGKNFRHGSKNANSMELMRRLQKTGLHRHSNVARLMHFLEIDPSDVDLHQLLVEKLEDEELKEVLLQDYFRSTSPTSQSEFNGEIILGSISPHGVLWRVSPEQLVCGTLIAGRPGGGKTNLIFLILTQLLGGL